MERTRWMIFLTLSCFLILSCGGKATDPKSQVSFAYQEEGILLDLKADPRLNLFQGSPHTLTVCVYQLSDPNGFNQLTGDEDGLYKLLECGRFDASVATAKSLSIQPGQKLQESLSRAEDATYVGFVAGYFTLQKEHIVRLFEVPVLTKRKWYNPLSKTYEPGKLTIELLLGPQEIQELGGKK